MYSHIQLMAILLNIGTCLSYNSSKIETIYNNCNQSSDNDLLLKSLNVHKCNVWFNDSWVVVSLRLDFGMVGQVFFSMTSLPLTTVISPEIFTNDVLLPAAALYSDQFFA